MIRYIGLDFETSTADAWGDAVPIEIGIAYNLNRGERPEDDYYQVHNLRIGRWDWKVAGWDPESAAVHGITKEELEGEPPVWQVDAKLSAAMLFDGFTSNRMNNIAVGWNVAGFDRQFITRWFPYLDKVFSYRTFDLNVLCFAIAGSDEGMYNKVKREAKKYAQGKIGQKANWHQAGYDAHAALHSMQYLLGILFETREAGREAAHLTLGELREQARRAAELLNQAGLGTSDPEERLARKERMGLDTTLERQSIESRKAKGEEEVGIVTNEEE